MRKHEFIPVLECAHRLALIGLQGPLGFRWNSRKWGILPRIENSDIRAVAPASPDRIDAWVDTGIHVEGRPEWIFVEPPAVVATQVYPDERENGTTPNTLSNVAVRWVTTRGFGIVTGAPNGLPLARKFSFIAAGVLGAPRRPPVERTEAE